MEKEKLKHQKSCNCHNEKNKTFQVLLELRNAGELCDAEILVGNTSFPIHRVILSSSSTYFRVLFTNERFQSNRKKVIVPNVSVNTMNSILQFAYTQECCINCHNVENILIAADYFNMIRLLQCCCEFLRSGLNVDNCIGVKRLAQMYSCRELELAAHRYILQNFSQVYRQSDEFQQLDIDDVCEIISSDFLNVKSEETVLDAIVDWIIFYPNSRKHHFNRLLQKLRLELTTPCFVERIKRLCCMCGEDSSIILPHVPQTFSHKVNFDRENFSLTTARIPNEILFVIGGWSGGSPTGIIETYDVRTDQWIECPSVNSELGNRAFHACCTLGSKIYVIGGYDGHCHLNNVCCFDPEKMVWSESAPMHSKRCHVSAAIIDSYIYALGGYNGQIELKSAERYNPKCNQWTLIEDMLYQRSDAGAAALNNLLYVCGGFSSQQYLDSGEFYSPQTKQWTLIASMNSIRCGVSIIAYCDFIYALGGFSGVTRVTSAERYDPSINKWQSVETMSIPRSNFAATILDDKIFVVGGVADENSIYNVEYYDIVTERWHNSDADDVTVCVVELNAGNQHLIAVGHVIGSGFDLAFHPSGIEITARGGYLSNAGVQSYTLTLQNSPTFGCTRQLYNNRNCMAQRYID